MSVQTIERVTLLTYVVFKARVARIPDGSVTR